ncbi:MAG: SAM-dependent DNA methyltransferase, partial [Fimbriimonadales bacterium]
MEGALIRRRRRAYGEHLTPARIFETYILPELVPYLRRYRWVDLFAGKGNLIFPLLEQIEPAERADFFESHIRLYDIQPEMVDYCVQRAVQLGVPESLARQNIRQ